MMRRGVIRLVAFDSGSYVSGTIFACGMVSYDMMFYTEHSFMFF